MSFASLGLIEPLLRAVAERGYTEPTPIQTQAIPAVLNGGDLMAGAQTGTGKTAGFTLPILQRLTETSPRKRGAIRALVLTPTRELAAQVEESVRHYGVHLPLKSMVMFGGVSINPQIAELRRGVDILVATPGRLLDHVQQKTIDLSGIEILVLDEADRMLDMGFIRDIKKVLALLPKQRQNLLFSATFSDEIKALADGLLNKPAMIEVARRNTTTELVGQRVMLVEQKAKRHLLAHLIKEHQWFQVLVFTRTKHGANRLAEQLTKGGINSLAIHGNKSQNARTRALSEFKSGELQVLVATDIAARGLDIVELPHVVNFELPNVPEDYVHRIGRTGRAGASGEALSLVSSDEQSLLRDIERFTKRSIPRADVPAFELPANASAEADLAREPRQPRQQRQPRKEGEARAPRNGSGERTSQGPRRTASPRQPGQGEPRESREPRQSREPRVPREPRESREPRDSREPRARQDGAQQRQGRSSQPRPDGDAPRRNQAAPGERRPAGEGRRTGQGASRGNVSQHAQHGRPQRAPRGEVNGNVIPKPPREVNGNVIEKRRPEADGNRAHPEKETRSGGIKGVFKRAFNALRSS